MSWMKSLSRSHKSRAAANWDEVEAQARQRGAFVELGLDYDLGSARLEQALHALGGSFEPAARGSVHRVLFAALSLTLEPKRILELGTYDGETARLLAELFPSARITTLDLPHNDQRFAGFYHGRDEFERAAFIARQRANTARRNIDLQLVDSFLLPSMVSPGIDLVWVDGGHLYPVIAWDISNAFHLAADDAWILVDDVLAHSEAKPHALVSRDSFEVIEYLREQALVEVTYLLKRPDARWSAKAKRRKFVAVLRKRHRPTLRCKP